jgi:protein phosphatase
MASFRAPIGANRSRRPQASSAAETHCGLRRKVNQDAFLDRPSMDLWAVADGVGGLSDGERASLAVIAALELAEPSERLVDDIADRLFMTNRDLRLEAVVEGKVAIASTVVVLVADHAKRHFTCLWVGDSRLYRLRAGVLAQITRDHTPLQEMGDTQRITPSDRKLTDAISRAVGSEDTLNVERIEGSIKPGDIFLLCTDGLSKPVAPESIRELLSSGKAALSARYLIDAALAAGGPDNVTAIVVTFPKEARTAKGMWRRLRYAARPKPAKAYSSPLWLGVYLLVFLSFAATLVPLLQISAAPPTGGLVLLDEDRAYRWSQIAIAVNGLFVMVAALADTGRSSALFLLKLVIMTLLALLLLGATGPIRSTLESATNEPVQNYDW